MAYNASIPQANDRISASQPLILGNFIDINTALAVNHIGFNLANVGKHKFLQMPEQAAAPATAANEAGLYCKQGSINNVAELFFRRESSGDEINFTESGQNLPGWTRLPSGVLIKWGTGSVDATGQTTNTFEVTDGANAIPAFTATPWFMCLNIVAPGAYAIWYSGHGDNSALQYRAAVTKNSGTVSGGTCTLSVGAGGFRYLAIGI